MRAVQLLKGNQTITMKMRPSIGPENFDRKMEYTTKKLRQGLPVTVQMQLRGAEVLNPDPGRDLLQRVAALVEGFAVVGNMSPVSSRTIEMLLLPNNEGPPPDPDREPR